MNVSVAKGNNDCFVVLDNVLQTYCIEADDEKGYIVRMIVNNNYESEVDDDGNIKTEKLYGKVNLFYNIDAKFLEENNIEVYTPNEDN